MKQNRQCFIQKIQMRNCSDTSPSNGFRYFVKPWNFRAARNSIQRATNHFFSTAKHSRRQSQITSGSRYVTAREQTARRRTEASRARVLFARPGQSRRFNAKENRKSPSAPNAECSFLFAQLLRTCAITPDPVC